MDRFAKLFESEERGQVLVTNTYDSDEDVQRIQVSAFSKKLGGCFAQLNMDYEDENEAEEAFSKIKSIDDIPKF